MTDDLLKQALTAAEEKLPDGCFSILLVGQIPAFGDDRIASVEVATSASAAKVKEIIVRLARSIERGDAGEATEIGS